VPLGLLGVMGLTACFGPTVPPAVTVRVGFFSTQDFLPLFVIQEQALDRVHGLHLEAKSFAGGAGVIAAIVDGSIDLGAVVGTVPLLSAAERGLVPDTLVAVAANNFADGSHRAIGVIAAPAVRRWADLRGARLATNARDSITTAALAARLRLEGVSGYTFVEIPFANMGLAVAGGNVAAAGMNEPFLTQSLARGDGVLLDWIMGGGAPFARAQVGSIVVATDFLRQRPAAVTAYLRAHLRAVRWINANRESARAVLVRRLDLAPDVGSRMNLVRWPDDARHDPALLDEMQTALVDTGLLKARIPSQRLYQETLLDQVLADRARASR
jgi:NitT/TauT family transport system substrate-binding protein